jgi:hypothetical protein
MRSSQPTRGVGLPSRCGEPAPQINAGATSREADGARLIFTTPYYLDRARAATPART